MSMTKSLFMAVLLLLTVGLFAQDSTKSQFITDRQTYIPKLWPNEQKTSKDKQRQTELDYIAKAKKIDPMQKWLTAYCFIHRFNINALDKFKELGVKYEYMFQSAHGTSYKEHAAQAQVIVLGTVEDITILDEKEYRYNFVIKVKIEKLIAGSKYSPVYSEYLYIAANRHENLDLKKGEKGLMFLTRAYWYDFDPQKALDKNQKINDIVFRPDTFLPVSYSTIRIKEDGNIENTHHDAKSLPLDPTSETYKVSITLDQIIEQVKKIYDTNDTYNFFNREYR